MPDNRALPMIYAPEPLHLHGKPAPLSETSILLCNLGTPDEPTAPALRRYLAEFLSDPRVVEIPRLLWLPILHGIILRVRPKKSAAKYASIWTPEGSPLKVWTDKQAKLLAGYLGERGHRVAVRYAMRYGNPSIPSVLDEMKSAGAKRVLVLPLYPQYSGPTTASAGDAVFAWALRSRAVPELRFVNRYHDDAGYIGALAKRISDQTARLLAERLQLKDDAWTVTFQSRFGKAQWLQPYTEPTLRELAAKGVKRVDLICPGFTGDCLETLEEIGLEARAAFLSAGGEEFNYIPCLNDQHEWIAALTDIAVRHMQGWDTRSLPDAASLQARRERALALGAER